MNITYKKNEVIYSINIRRRANSGFTVSVEDLEDYAKKLHTHLINFDMSNLETHDWIKSTIPHKDIEVLLVIYTGLALYYDGWIYHKDSPHNIL